MPHELPIVDAPLGREFVVRAARGHGEASLTGSVSYVKIEAIPLLLYERYGRCFGEAVTYGPDLCRRNACSRSIRNDLVFVWEWWTRNS